MLDKGIHYEESVAVRALPNAVFDYANDHKKFSSHMNKSSWMMGGGKMSTKSDSGNFQKMGSHLTMEGLVFGINLFLDEVVTKYRPPFKKEWETVGDINLLVIDHYRLGFEILPKGKSSIFKVYIDYNLPKSWKTYWLGILFGKMYARWCVQQMSTGVNNYFNKGR